WPAKLKNPESKPCREKRCSPSHTSSRPSWSASAICSSASRSDCSAVRLSCQGTMVNRPTRILHLLDDGGEGRLASPRRPGAGPPSRSLLCQAICLAASNTGLERPCHAIAWHSCVRQRKVSVRMHGVKAHARKRMQDAPSGNLAVNEHLESPPIQA